ncbi:unnamed protein product [Linum trigynum]|uniref:Uncharacterized protein n=1 Tax=Linum trigynum TaxID=586398 RepID=A0AAV2DAR1_9ROSI
MRGIESVEEVIKLLNQLQFYQEEASASGSSSSSAVVDDRNIQAVTDLAVYNFRKVIHLLDKTNRTGQARFRRAPVPASTFAAAVGVTPRLEKKIVQDQPGPSSYSAPVIVPPPTKQRYCSVSGGSAVKVYQPTPIHRLPPLPTNHHQKAVALAKERNDLVPSSTIIFSNSPSISAAATSFISSLTGDIDNMQRSMSSSGFQFTQPSHESLPCLLPPSRGSAA